VLLCALAIGSASAFSISPVGACSSQQHRRASACMAAAAKPLSEKEAREAVAAKARAELEAARAELEAARAEREAALKALEESKKVRKAPEPKAPKAPVKAPEFKLPSVSMPKMSAPSTSATAPSGGAFSPTNPAVQGLLGGLAVGLLPAGAIVSLRSFLVSARR